MQAADVYPGKAVGALARPWRLPRLAVVIVFTLHWIAGISWALDIVTADGHLYKGCTITQVEPDALRFSHSDGAARVVYEQLPSALQKQYFDPAKVAVYREQLEEARRVAAAKAEEERRQRQIAAAQAAEQRQRENEARQREERARQEAEEDKRMIAKQEEALSKLTKHRVTMFGLGMLGFGALLALFVYFLPTIIGRHKANSVAIFALNLFLGWTLLGWVVALIWACTEDSAMERLARERLNAPLAPPAPPQPYQAQGGQQLPQGAVRRLDQGGRYIENGGRYLE